MANRPIVRRPSSRSLRKLLDRLAECDGDRLLDQVGEAAAEICDVEYAGLLEVDVVSGATRSVHVLTPRGEAARLVLARLMSREFLLTWAVTHDPVRADDGGLRVLSVPMPLTTRCQALIWVAGRDFDEHDEELLARFATGAARGRSRPSPG